MTGIVRSMTIPAWGTIVRSKGLRLISAAFGAVLSAQALASSIDLSQAPTMSAMTTIPSQGIKIVESEGRIMAMSANGRWVFEGRIFDTWQMKQLHTMSEVQESIETIKIDALKLDIADLGPLTLGRKGLPEVTLFVDPLCGSCKPMLADIKRLSDSYRFNLLLVGVLGPESAQRTRELWCADDRDGAIDALIRQNPTILPQSSDCGLEPLQRTLVTAQLFGLEGVPFLIAPNGRIHRGAPNDLSSWIEQNSL